MFDIDKNTHLFQLADGDLLLVDRESYWTTFSWIAWRIRNGKAVTFAKFFTPNNINHPGTASICDIEVRKGHRGQGLAKQTIEDIGRIIGAPLHTTGGFTPKGYAALKDVLPLLPGYPEGSVQYNDMSFVEDWEQPAQLVKPRKSRESEVEEPTRRTNRCGGVV